MNKNDLEKLQNFIKKSYGKDIIDHSIEDEMSKAKKIFEEQLKNFNDIKEDNKVEETSEKIKNVLNELPKELSTKLKEGSLTSKDSIEKAIKLLNEFSSLDEKKDYDLMQEAKKQAEEFDDKIESSVVDLKVDPINGSFSEVQTEEKKINTELSDKIKEDIPLDKEQISKGIKSSLSQYGNISDEESAQLLEAILKFKKDDKFPVYNYLPESLKQLCRAMALKKNIAGFHEAARDLIKMFMNELKIDKEIIDFQKSINEALDVKELGDLYSEHLKELMEVKLLNAADEIESKEPEKAKLWREVSKSFTDSYTMSRQLEYLNTQSGIRHNIKKQIKNFNKLINNINFKYQDTKVGIHNIRDAVVVLSRKLDSKYTLDDIKRFVALYYLITMNMNPENTVEHAYMYYTISNIIALDYLNDSEFNRQLLSNISMILNKLREVCN